MELQRCIDHRECELYIRWIWELCMLACSYLNTRVYDRVKLMNLLFQRTPLLCVEPSEVPPTSLIHSVT